MFRRQRIALSIEPHRFRVRSLTVADLILHFRGLLSIDFKLRLIIAILSHWTLPKRILRLDFRSFEGRNLRHYLRIDLIVLKDGYSLRLIFVGNLEEVGKFLHCDLLSRLKVFVDMFYDDPSDVLA